MSDSDEPKPRRRRRKKIGRAPRELVILKNADKGFHENYRPGDSPIRFPHPWRLIIAGKCNSGKTLMIANIMMAAAARKPKFEQLIVVHGDPETKEYDMLDPTCIRTTIPTMEELDPSVKSCIIIDDFEWDVDKEGRRRISELVRFGSTHRNTSVAISHQNFTSIPKIARDSANVFIVYRPHDLDTLTLLGRRIGLVKEEVHGIFREHLPKWRDSLMINLIDGAPYKYAKNLFQPLEIDDGSDSD